MERKVLLEQQEQIKKMFSYKPGMTISENDKKYKQNIQEIAPLAAVGWGLTAAWAGYKIWKWADNTWGSKKLSTRLGNSLKRNTWEKIYKSIRQTSVKLGEEVKDKLQIISNSKASQYAEKLYEAMNGPMTYENQIRAVMDNLSSFMDLAKVAYKFGKRASSYSIDGKRYTLWGWLDDELSQSYFKRYVIDPMKSKPLLVWDGRQYNDLEKWAAELTKLIQDKEDQPGKDEETRERIIAQIVYNFGNCYKEYLKHTTLGWSGKGTAKERRANNKPFIRFKEYNQDIAILPNGRFYDIKKKKKGSIAKCSGAVRMTETVEDILKVDWVLGGSISEQFNIIYDDDKSNPVTIIDDTKDETRGETQEPPKSEDPVKSKPQWTLYTGDPTIKDEFVRIMHYNTDAGSIIKQIQKILGLKEDGYFGKNTKKAVMDYQKEHGLKVDGGVGVETWAKMNETIVVAGEELTQKDANDVEKEIVKVVQDVQQNKVNVPTRREEIQNEVLGAQGNKKMQKNYCKNLIAFEAGMLKSNMEKATDLKALATCYNEYNFRRIGDNSKKVRKAYNLKKSGNPV